MLRLRVINNRYELAKEVMYFNWDREVKCKRRNRFENEKNIFCYKTKR